MYRPSEAAQMTTAIQLQQPVKPVKTKSYGVSQKSYKDVDGVVMANFKTYGGTEKPTMEFYRLKKQRKSYVGIART